MKNFLATVIVVAILIAGVIEWGFAAFNAPGPAAPQGTETIVVIKPGSGTHGATEALVKAGVVLRGGIFEIGVHVLSPKAALKAGEYAIPSHASMHEVMNILVAGKSIQHKVTLAEGLTSQMVYDIVKADKVLKGSAGAVPAEGTLLPETYLFQRGETRAHLIAKMKAAQTAVIDALWERRAEALPIKSKEEALILASIVEKETGIPSERAHIASVFMNRLRIGMKLQSDPTIIYGITKGYPIGRRINRSEIEAATPYNTYVIPALPPEPICNPGKDAIAAVLNPIESKDLYFVADGSGGHVFAETVEEQTKHVAAWRKIHIGEGR
ncbi:MAG: endolytic transglycosylase MltG [Rhizomicrobium sp.]|nr:endolytic transglycosylase MltG [Rhizomicrobium sp.]